MRAQHVLIYHLIQVPIRCVPYLIVYYRQADFNQRFQNCGSVIRYKYSKFGSGSKAFSKTVDPGPNPLENCGSGSKSFGILRIRIQILWSTPDPNPFENCGSESKSFGKLRNWIQILWKTAKPDPNLLKNCGSGYNS